MKARLPTLCAAALLLALPHAQATSFAVLLATGIPGECADPAFLNWIELTSLGLTGPLPAGTPGTFSISKRIDKASPLLARQCASGQHIKEAKLVLRQTNPTPGSPPVICVITMSDLLVSSFSSARDGANTEPTETVGLKFRSIYFQYFPTDGSAPQLAYLSLAQNALDSDGDGMPDAWEIYYGLDPYTDNANADHDGDGLTDLQECRLGTNPVSGASLFAAGAAPVAGDPSSLDISWNAVPGSSYVVEWTPSLSQAFAPLGNPVVPDSPNGTVRLNKSGPTGFFRVRLTGP